MEYMIDSCGQKRKAELVICNQCKTVFLKRKDLVREFNFCSKSCYGKWRTKDKLKICESCGDDFYYKRREQRFCSVTCASSRSKQDRMNTGKSRIEIIHENIKDLGWDGFCMIDGCYYNNTLDNHRILSGKDGGLYNIHNISVICPNHHAEIHRLCLELKRIGQFNFILVG